MRITLSAALLAIASVAAAQPSRRPAIGNAVRPYVVIDTSAVALTRVRVIDGTGAAPKVDQIILVENGRIAAIGDASQVRVPAGAQTLDLTGKSVIPGLVMVHEHLF